MNQNQRIIEFLSSGRRIDNQISMRELGIYALSQRMGEIAKYKKVHKRWKTVMTRDGKSTRVMEYWL